MAVIQSKTEVINANNSLRCLIPALQGNRITIDLENECVATGLIREVDGYMNITLEKAQLVSLDNYCHHYDMLYIRNRCILFIHLPKEINVRETIINYLKPKRLLKQSSTIGPMKRKLLKRQKEIDAQK